MKATNYFSINQTLLMHSFLSVLCILALAICLGFFFSYIRKFAASHNPFGAVLINYLTFVGVFHHELSHALFAYPTFAKVTEIKLFQFNQKNGALGYVNFIPRGNFITKSIQKVFISTAPIITGIISCSLLYTYVRPLAITELWSTILFYYVLISIILHMSLSKPDIKLMKSGIVVVVILLTALFYFAKIDFLVLAQSI